MFVLRADVAVPVRAWCSTIPTAFHCEEFVDRKTYNRLRVYLLFARSILFFVRIMSSALQWLIVKDNHCYIRKQKMSRGEARQFSVEPFNVTGKNNFSSSGLCNNKAIDVSLSGGLTFKDSGKKVSLVGFKASKQNATIKSNTSNYRSDLQAKAMARYSVLKRASHVKHATRTYMGTEEPILRRDVKAKRLPRSNRK